MHGEGLRHGIRAEDINRAFEDLLARLQLSPDLLPLLTETLRRQWVQRNEQTRIERDRLRREVVAVEQRSERLLRAFLYEGILPREDYHAESERLRARKTEIQQSLAELQEEETLAEGRHHPFERYAHWTAVATGANTERTPMNLTMRRRITVVGVVFALSVGYVPAQDADPVIGTWVLNVRKSNFSPGPGPQGETRTYTLETQQTKVTSRTSQPRTYLSVGQEIKATSMGVDGDGKLTTEEWTIVDDGRDRPITGDVDADMLSVRRVDRYLKEFTKKRAGRAVITGTYAISTDGRVMTITSTGVNAKGQTIKNVAVFDKQ